MLLWYDTCIYKNKNKIPMKKLFSFIAMIAIILSLFPVNNTSASESGYFIVTAYYSPLPGQKNYATGDYVREKILNGQWKAWASWRKVFSGMLAAPGKYGFGTKIYLEWLGIGSVEDRWGAIVPAWERGFAHDRIDVWMGYGDEWLRRAMYWGKRKVKWHVVKRNSGVTLNMKTIPAPAWIAKYIKRPSGSSSYTAVSATSTWPNVFNKSIGTKSNPEDIKTLQKFLQSIGKYNWEINGIYNEEIMNFVYDFQIENKLVTSWSDTYAGYWGASVRNLLGKKYLNGDFKEIEKQVEVELSKHQKLEELFKNPLSTIEETKFLQEVLTEMEIYSGEINGVYSDIKDTILDYQLDNKIIQRASDTWGGYFGPKTRAHLKNARNTWEQEQILIREKEAEIHTKKEEIKTEFNTLIKESEVEASKIVSSLWTPELGEIGTHVRALQIELKNIGYFGYKDTAIFGVKTQNAIIDYQIAKNLVRNASDIWAGRLWPKTKGELKKDIKEYILKEKLKSSWILDTIESLEIKSDSSEVSTEKSVSVNHI